MTTHFIAAEIDLTENPAELPQQVEAELKKRGEPLRWAISEVDPVARTAKVEAVIIDQSVAQSESR